MQPCKLCFFPEKCVDYGNSEKGCPNPDSATEQFEKCKIECFRCRSEDICIVAKMKKDKEVPANEV